MRRFVRRRFLVVLALVTAVWLWLPVMPAIVLGSSMAPTLHNGQLVGVDRGYYGRHAIQRGDVVLFRFDGVTQVKRVHALPGDRVWEVHCLDTESVFLADPKRIEAARRHVALPSAGMRLVEVRVPNDTVYLLGDGGNVSYDSRYYGPVPQDAVMGRVLMHEEGAWVAQQALERATLFIAQ